MDKLTPQEFGERATTLYELAVRVSSSCEHIDSEACASCSYIEVCKEVRKDDWAFVQDWKKGQKEAEEGKVQND